MLRRSIRNNKKLITKVMHLKTSGNFIVPAGCESLNVWMIGGSGIIVLKFQQYE